LANTAIGRGARALLVQYATSHSASLQKWHVGLKKVFTGDSSPSDAVTGSPEAVALDTLANRDAIVVECVENQRWWAGLSWISHMLRNERGPWSNLDGSVAAPSLSDFADPSEAIALGIAFADAHAQVPLPVTASRLKWMWAPDSQWVVDTTWSDDIGTRADEEGWVYTDNHWQVTKRKSNWLTRRRRWIRMAVLASSSTASSADSLII
jgi:hypothetical protein